MRNEASYIPNKMRVLETKSLSPTTKALTLEFVDKKMSLDFTFEPGQFVLISIPGFGEGTFAITSAKSDLPKIDIAVHSIGNLTKAIHRLKKDGEIWLRGPYGNSFPLKKLGGDNILLIAGGIGLAPLRSLARTIDIDRYPAASMKLFVGSREPHFILYKNELKSFSKNHEVYLSVNKADGDWDGHVGHITAYLEKSHIEPDSIAIVCGPQAMFEPVAKKLLKAGVEKENIYVMLERRLKCGIGKCQHCTCGDKYVCLDGPVFNWAEIQNNFEAMV